MVAADEVFRFLPGVAEKLGWYVYALRDPRDDMAFYVGEGRGDRTYQDAILANKQPLGFCEPAQTLPYPPDTRRWVGRGGRDHLTRDRD